MSGIILHPEYGLNPTIIRAMCPVCGKEFETNELALLGRNKGRKADMYTTTHYDLCPEHKKLNDDGYIALVGVDSRKSTYEPDGNLKLEGAYRTGKLAHIRRTVFKDMFGSECPNIPMIFVDSDISDKLEIMQREQEIT